MPKGVYLRSEKTKKNLSLARKGKMPWNKGKKGLQQAWNKGIKWSDEVKRKVSETKRSRPRKMTDEEKKRLSEYNKKIGRKPPVVRFFGEKHPNWKGGVTPLNRRIRQQLEYRLWRKAVFERDNYICIWCGARNGEGKTIILNADHIKPFAQFPELRFAIDNGRTLCLDCHKTTDTYGGRNKNRNYSNHSS